MQARAHTEKHTHYTHNNQQHAKKLNLQNVWPLPDAASTLGRYLHPPIRQHMFTCTPMLLRTFTDVIPLAPGVAECTKHSYFLIMFNFVRKAKNSISRSIIFNDANRSSVSKIVPANCSCFPFQKKRSSVLTLWESPHILNIYHNFHHFLHILKLPLKVFN